MKLSNAFKRIISGTLCLVMAAEFLPVIPASADVSAEKFPYALFASSNEEGAITVDAGNFCINGNVSTNGTIISTGNMNLNGTRTENAGAEMIIIANKLNDTYFSTERLIDVPGNYELSDTNLNLNQPIRADGEISLNGNINLNTQIKASGDIWLENGTMNANNALIYSEMGDITVDLGNLSFDGLIYAPNGDVTLEAGSINMNNAVVIAQTIQLRCDSANCNYSSSVGEFVGTVSETPSSSEDETFYFMASGTYSAETNAIDIRWYASAQPETVSISTSPDNTVYEPLTVVTNAESHSLPINDGFTSTYYKVSYTDADGTLHETTPFAIEKSSSGYRMKLQDSDEDGLSDINEENIGTNPLKSDSDDDGLTDYEELVLAGTDPLNFDSAVRNVSDADADVDEDGLTNRQEIDLGTDPKLADSDNDNLTDSEELVYLTNPLLEDTDGDTLSDGFEVQNGLNPLSAETDGIADMDRQIEQTIASDSAALAPVNTEDSPFALSLKVLTNGEAERNLTAAESDRSEALATDSQIGDMFELAFADGCAPEKMVLSFTVKNEFRMNTLNKYSDYEELQGIKRLCVFKYDETVNMMLPLETAYDVANNLLMAEANSEGTYCVMDLEIWFDLFDVETADVAELASRNNIAAEASASVARTAENAAFMQTVAQTQRASVTNTSTGLRRITAPVDMVFLLQTAGPSFSSEVYSAELDALETAVDYAFKRFSNVRVFVVEYQANTACKVMFGDRPYCTSSTAFSNGIRALSYTIDDTYCDTRLAFNEVKNNLWLRQGVNTFIYHIHNGSNWYYLDNDGVCMANADYGIFSQVIPSGYHYLDEYYGVMLDDAIQANGGINITLSADTAAVIAAHMEEHIDTDIERTEFDALIGTSLKKITLDAALQHSGLTNSDTDTLTDWQEVKSELITYNPDSDSFTLPTLQRLIQTAKAENYITPDSGSYPLRSGMMRLIWFTPVLPCNSDPTSADTDGDGIQDDHDPAPSSSFDSNFIRVNSIDDMPTIDFMNPNLLGYGDTAYDPKYGTPVEDGRDACFARKFPDAGNLKDYALLSIEAEAGRLPITTNIAGKIIFHDFGKEMYNAGEFLQRFLMASVGTRTLTTSEMEEIISTSSDNLFHFMHNINALRDLAESSVQDGESVIFASNHCDNFKICCYAQKHCELAHLCFSGFESTDKSFDWSYAIGEAFCSLAMDVARDGSTYTSTVKMKLSDYYEWGYHIDGGDKEQHMLHESGLAREYPITGELTLTMSWNAGERLDRSVYQLYEALGIY